MIYPDKTKELRNIINRKLLPLIDHDYVYLDLPYHTNLGDTLIWEGTLQFLKQSTHRCLYASNLSEYRKPKISKETVILLHGGGNWGDLWPVHHDFRKRVIAEFPDNRVIVLPQSVHYEEQENIKKDICFFKQHPHVIICTRDQASFDILANCLPNEILLVPDMAFYIQTKTWRSTLPPPTKAHALYAKRMDKELCKDADTSMLPNDVEVHDWPTIESVPDCLKQLDKYRKLATTWEKRLHLPLTAMLTDWYWKNRIRPEFVRTAFRFLEPYQTIYSTRLHISILSVLLGKDLHIIDNSYAKTQNYFNTWF